LRFYVIFGILCLMLIWGIIIIEWMHERDGK